MLFLADENFNGRLLKGLIQRIPELDVIRVQDTELLGQPDPQILEWASEQNRILLTHDVETIIGFTYDRVKEGKSMPGVIEVRITSTLGETIDDLEILIRASTPEDFDNQVRYIPLN